MTSLQRYTCKATIIGLCLAAASGAYAQPINGYYTNPRVFNYDPGSILTITPAAPINANPVTININDSIRDLSAAPIAMTSWHRAMAA